MEFKGIQKAKEYAIGKSSSEVFRQAHENDFLAGYKKGIEDACAPEMLESLKKILSHYDDVMSGDFSSFALRSEIDGAKELIKKATTI